MRRIVSHVLSAMVLLAIATPALAQQRGSLRIESVPEGATVYIDKVRVRQETPVTVSLPLGQHQVTVTFPNSGWAPNHQTVNIRRGRNEELYVILLPAVTQPTRDQRG